MYGICKGNMDESFDNPLKLQYLIFFQHNIQPLKSITCLLFIDLLKECDRKHKDNYCFIPLSVHWLRKDVLI